MVPLGAAGAGGRALTGAEALPLLAGRGRELLRRLERAREWRVLGAIVLVAWLAVLGLALTVRHSGWTWYQGGDQLWFYTDGWLLAHGHLGYAGVGYLWPALLAPIALVAGPNVSDAFPAVILIDVLVLLPVALVALYGIGKRVAGRVFGYWCCAVFVALPFVGILYVNAGYHQRYVEQFLPQALGLTALSDFPALVAALVSGYFCLRIVLDEQPRVVHAIASGLAAGAAIGVKPSAALFLGGPALALFDARRARPALFFAAGLLPALATTALWKLRSTGNVPLVAPYASLHTAAVLSLPLAVNFHRLINLDWGHLGDELANLRRYFAVGRLVEWAPVAGLFGLARRSPGAAVLAAGWLGTFVVVKGTWDSATLQTGSLLRIMIPAFPAFVLLVASLPLLWPGLPDRLHPEPVRPSRFGRRTAQALVAAVLLTAAVPFVAIAAAAPERGPNPHAVAVGSSNGPIPTDVDVGLTATRSGNAVVLTWKAQHPAGGPVFYHVFRGPASAADYSCDTATSVQRCYLGMADLGATRSTRFVDRDAQGGPWAYRIGVSANWLDDPTLGDVYVLSSRVVASG
ncbi:MAG TPA: hypothetical protein VHD91_10105 [Gaiellaceae bacterium]|nr:hypothetical protein [Gaiellaceae bacterium]